MFCSIWDEWNQTSIFCSMWSTNARLFHRLEYFVSITTSEYVTAKQIRNGETITKVYPFTQEITLSFRSSFLLQSFNYSYYFPEKLIYVALNKEAIFMHKYTSPSPTEKTARNGLFESEKKKLIDKRRKHSLAALSPLVSSSMISENIFRLKKHSKRLLLLSNT